MSSVAHGEALRRRPRARAQGVRPLAGGVLWIVLLACLLAGVVAVNVSVLGLNLELDRADRERAQLRADIAALRAEISAASASARIERLARDELGLVKVDPETLTFVTLPR
ncbi:MAG TPA: cell division protein FtsL [Gaiellaceae bacterium]|nr:cell division protein FtsL [Gaiellaceae bacterium]